MQTLPKGLHRNELAALVAQDIENGWYVNLGIGAPEKVANYIAPDKDVILHSENGILGMGEAATPEQYDWDLINAGKRPVTLLQGAAFFDHVSSFTMMRGGHLDLCLLGAYQVSAQGDLANWWTGGDELPAVGGAMDLVSGAKRVFVMMDHLSKTGQAKIVPQCSYPLTGQKVVDRIYTNYAVLDVSPEGLVLQRIVEHISIHTLQEITAAPFTVSPHLASIPLPARCANEH